MTLEGVVTNSLWGSATDLEKHEWHLVAEHYEAVLELEGTTEFKHEDIVKRLEKEKWLPKVFNPVIERAEAVDVARMLVSLSRGV